MIDGEVTIFIPVKDEVDGLKYLIDDFKKNISTNEKLLNQISFIFIIDGRTTDASKSKAIKILELSDKKNHGNNILNQEDTHGKGAAIRQAIDLWKNSPTPFVIFLDADGSHSFSDIEPIIKKLCEGSDVVSGSRFMRHHSSIQNTEMQSKNDLTEMGRLHIFGNKLLSKISSVKNKRKITDLCTGIWGFTEKALLLLNLESEGFDLEAEIAGKCTKNNLLHTEIPILWSPRKGGMSKLRSFRDGFIILLRIIRT